MRDNTINIEYGFDIHSQEAIDSRFILDRYDMRQIGLHDDDPTSKYHTARFPEQYFALLIDSEGHAEQLYVYDQHRAYDSEAMFANEIDDDSFIGKFCRVDYEYIKKHPYINGVEVVGDMTAEDLGLQGKLVVKGNQGIKLTELLDSEGKTYQLIELKIDDKTILFNADGQLMVALKDGHATKAVADSEGVHVNVIHDGKTVIVGSEGLEVPIDNTTIKLVNGKLKAMAEGLIDGKASHAAYDSEANEYVDVLVDDETITINDDNNLEVVHDDSLIVESEGLHVNIDNRTLYQDSEGKIKAQLRNAYASMHELQGLRSDLQGYVFEALYTGYDYEDAKKYQEAVFPFGCSAVKNGNFYGRNLDWTYDDNAEFVVRTPRIGGRFATMGIGCALPLTRDFVRSGAYSDRYKLLPLFICDGINEKGVIANTNVVPNDRGITYKSVPEIEVRKHLVSSCLVRFVLDNFDSAQAAAEYIRDYVEVETNRLMASQGFEQHFMVADANKTYVIEFLKVGSVVKNVIKEQTCMTNFYENDVTFDANGKAYTPYTHSIGGPAATTQGIENHGCGLERWNLIKDNYASANTKAGMRALMNDLFYTKAYTLDNTTHPELFWFTEYTSNGSTAFHNANAELTVDDAPSAFALSISNFKAKYAARSRVETDPNFGTWQTTHSTVFDVANKCMSIVFQEDTSRVFEFNFDYYTKDQIDEFLLDHQIDDKTIKRNNHKAYVPIDNKTIFVDSEDGLIKANPEALKDGKATHAYYTSEGYEKVDVLFDNYSITLNSEGKLQSRMQALEAGEAIEIDSEAAINVLYNNKELVLDSEGKLAVDFDEKTIILTSEGLATRIGGWLETTADYEFANQTGTIANPNPTVMAWGGSFLPEAGVRLNVKVQLGALPEVVESFDPDEVKDLGDGYITAISVGATHTYLDGIRFKKDLSVIEYTFDPAMLAMGTFTAKVYADANLYHQIKGKYIPVDNNTIVLNRFGKLEAVAADLKAGEAIKIDSEGAINVLYDDESIKINSEGKLYAVAEALKEGKAIKVDSEGKINVKFDNDTIKLNSEGQLEAAHEVLEDGIATEALYNSEGHEVVNVLFDGETIQLTSEGELKVAIDGITLKYNETTHQIEATGLEVEQGEAIEVINAGVSSEGKPIKKINVKFDKKSIVLNADGKLIVNVDDETIYLNSEGKLVARPEALVNGKATKAYYDSEGHERVDVLFDNETIKLDSEGKLFAVAKDLEAGKGIFIDSEGKINANFDEETIKLDSEGKLAVQIDKKSLVLDSEGTIAVKALTVNDINDILNA